MGWLLNSYRFAVAGVTTYVEDTFTDTNSTALTAHTPDTDVVGTGWEAVTNLFDIQSNKTTTNSSGDNVAVIDSGQADCTIRTTLNFDANLKYPAIMFRVTDADNMWYAQNTVNTTFEMIERTTASNTSRASTAKTFSNSTDYAFDVVLSGDSITAHVDGGSEITYSSSVRNTVTKHGIRAYQTETTFDDFSVKSA